VAMGTTGKYQRPRPPTETPLTDKKPRLDTTSLRSDLTTATRSYIGQVAYERKPYLKAAFANPYNISLFVGGLVAAAVTVSPFLAVISCCFEALWLLYGPESKVLRRLIWDPQFDRERMAQAQQEYAKRVEILSEDERARVGTLVARQQEINRLAAQNPSFTGELLRTELAKTDRLVQSFIDMAVTCARYEEYLASINPGELEGDRRKWDSIVKDGKREQAEIDIAKKNLAIVLKRFDKVKEIGHYLIIARGQLDLIENSFKLISDQIVTMQSPQQLSGQLDELLDGVESIKETAADTEGILSA